MKWKLFFRYRKPHNLCICYTAILNKAIHLLFSLTQVSRNVFLSHKELGKAGNEQDLQQEGFHVPPSAVSCFQQTSPWLSSTHNNLRITALHSQVLRFSSKRTQKQFTNLRSSCRVIVYIWSTHRLLLSLQNWREKHMSCLHVSDSQQKLCLLWKTPGNAETLWRKKSFPRSPSRSPAACSTWWAK